MKQRAHFKIWHLLVVTLIVALYVLSISNRWRKFDRDMAEDVPVVVRVELLESRGGSKYHWQTVKVLHVFKNETDETIPESVQVAHYGWNPGVPEGRSTLYLVYYNESKPEYGWKLHQPDSNFGVSHQSSK